MHPHGYCWAYAGIEVCDCDRFQVVPAYIFNSKLSFSKPYFKSNCFQRILFKAKDIWVSKYLLKNPILSYQKVSKLKTFAKINSGFGVKAAFKKREREILKSFAPLRTFGLFEMFLKPYPYFKVLCEKGISNHLYVYFKNFEKRRFSSNSVFKSAFL
jgi:hypothetical protein